jgi:molecular chaperone DnaJ
MVFRKKEVVLDFDPADERETFVFEQYGHFRQKTNNFADMYVKIKVKEHPIFKFVRPHIHSDYYLTISEAILGTSLKVYTIYGAKEVKVPPGTNHGDSITIKDHGTKLPVKGDHILNLKIDVPKRLNPSQEALLKKFHALYKKRVAPCT